MHQIYPVSGIKKFPFYVRLFVVLLLCLSIGKSWGQVNIMGGGTITQDFNAIGTVATATLPLGWKVDAQSTARTLGTYAAAGTATALNAGGSMSGTATSGIYNFGAGASATSSSDRAIGGLSASSSNRTVNVYLYLNNNGSSTISSFNISYNVEKYRTGTNAAGYYIQLYYSTDGVAWTSAGSNFLTSISADAATAGYTTAPGVTYPISSQSLPVAVPASAPLYLLWSYSVITGTSGSNAQALGVDDVSITANAATTSPTLTKTGASSISTSTASSGGTVTSNGGSAVTAEGAIWSTSSGVTTALSTKTSDGTATPFTSAITGLTANTKYYYNAYAINAIGTSYGTEANFTTLSNPPVIGSGTAPTTSGFTANWTAPATQGPEVYTYTVEVDDDPAFGSINQTVTAISSGTFSTIITGLSSSTTYYYRVKAVNATGSSAYSATSAGVLTSTVVTPTIAVSGTLTALTATYGTASSSTSFSVSGSGLTNDILITSPSGFEISLTAGSGYASSLTLIQSGGNVPSTTIYVRLGATTPAGTYAGNVALTSTGASPVNVATASSTVTQKILTITGLSATGKVYDRTTTATLSGTPVLNGVIGGDNVTLGGTPSALYADKNVGVSKPITVTGYTISGSSAANYTVTQPTGLTATITSKPLTITGITANNKTFDGTTTATLSGTPLLNGVVAGDIVTVSGGVGSFANANVGTAKPVTVTGYTLAGTDAGNYTVSQPTGLAADITIGSCFSTSGNIGWNFTDGTGNASTNSTTNLTISALSAGNQFGSVTTPISTTSASSGYSGASGTFNIGTAAKTGALVIGAAGSAYYEFTLTPASGYSVSLTSLSFGTRSTGTAPVAYTVRSDQDGYAADLATGSIVSTSAWALKTNSTISGNVSGSGMAITYRIYGYNGSGSASSGVINWRADDINISVAVNSGGQLTSPTKETICSGNLFTYTPTSNLSGASFSWTRATVAGISNATASGSGSISETLINTTVNPINVIYNYTISGSNCSNPNQYDTVTVNPTPGLSNFNTSALSPVNAGTPSTVTINSITLLSGTYTFTYNLSAPNSATGLTATVSFAGNNGSFATPNLTNPGSTTVTITSVANSTCSSTPASNNTAVISVVNTTIVINSLSATSFCITASTAAPVTIMFTSAGTYNTGNTYTAQLSDGTGSFASPVNIGVLSSTLNTGTINATLPAGSVAGIGYRIRVVASNPVTTGLDNGSDLIISNGPVITIDATNASVFSGNTATFSVVVTNAASYQWQVSMDNGATWANVTTGTGGTTATYTTPATTISMNGYLYRCQIIGASPCNTLSTTSAVAVLTVNTAASIWTNPITGSDPGSVSPYTSGDVTDPGLTVSGITRSAALPANPGGGLNRYNATNWPLSASIDLTKYFEFVLTPNAGYHINFLNFKYTGQRSSTGPRNFSIRSSLDGYTTDIAAVPAGGTTVNLAIPAFQNITAPIRFRFYGWNATGTTGTFSVDDFTFNGSVDPNCTATKLIFSSAFANTNQDAIIPSFTVSIACASNTVITSCSNGTITLTSSGCGLKGTITQPVINGVATFNDIHFSRSLQTSVSFSANYSGTCGTYTPALSNTFNVGFNGMGAPVTSDLRNENFDGSTPAWSYIIGTPTYTNTSSGTGTDVTGIKNFSGNNVMAKSFSVDNSSGSKGSTNTVTFSNVTGLGSYTSLNFSFQIGCIPVGPVGSGAGADNGEYLYIECSLDGGITWKRTLTNNGSGNHGFNLSPASPVSLQYDANAVYSSGNNLWGQSAFQVTLPPGTSQFMFRMIANDNRTNENWVVDNLLLQGTTIGSGTQSPLPVVTAYDILACPGSSNTISFSVANGVGTLSYLWTPNTNISSTTVNNPVVNPTVSTTYKGVVTDADGCKDSANIAVTVPSGPIGTWTGMVSKDYFNCLNWADGVVPVSTTDVSINTTVNSVEIDATSPFAGGFGNTATANNLAISNNNINFILGTEKLNLSNLSINSGANINMTNGGTINLTGIWSNSVGAAGFTSGIGMVNYSGTLAQTIAPENYYNLTSSSTGTRTIPGMGVVGISNIFDAGTNAFTLATGSTVDFNGGIAQVVPALDYYSLNLSNNDVKSIAGNTSVSGTLKLKDAASLDLGAKFLTLKSTVTGTAIVAPVTTTAGTPITFTSGKFVVERYYPARRSWRLVTAPVSTTRTIYNEWQVGGLDYTLAPNSGTFITSPIATDPGLDLSAHYSMKTYNSDSSKLVNVNNTKTTAISGNLQLPDVPDNIGYFIFVRGDRKMSLLNPYPITNARITTLRDTGVLQTGRKIFNASDTGFMLIGNPYASPVDFGNLGRSGVQKKFYAWDPRLNSYLGAYVVVDGLTPPGYIVTPSPDPMIGTTGQDSIIQSSQAIFVHANTATASVTFNESSKATEDNNTVFRPAATEQSSEAYSSLRTNLYVSDSDSAILADGVYTQFDNSFSSNVDSFDAVKFTNFLENFAIVQNGKTLTLERRKPVSSNDTIFFKLWNTTEKKYQLRFSAKGLSNDGIEGYLEDSYLKNKTPLNLNGYTNVGFIITGDQASKVSNRFMIVFKAAAQAPLPVIFTLINAYQQDKDINVEWKVNNESLVKEYHVDRSLNGQDFITSATVNPAKNNSGTANYLWPDKDIVAGTYYYRIKSVGTNGEVKYSNTVRVIIGKAISLIAIYPNPVINGNINVHLINQSGGTYYFTLINSLGQRVYSKQVELQEGSNVEILRPGKKMAHGSYQLEIMKPDKSSDTYKVLY